MLAVEHRNVPSSAQLSKAGSLGLLNLGDPSGRAPILLDWLNGARLLGLALTSISAAVAVCLVVSI